MTDKSAPKNKIIIPDKETVFIERHEKENDKLVNESISLISKSFALLDIGQLRSLLNLFSLPTTGVKNQLLKRLIVFVETFGPRQKYIIPQIQMELKLFLSDNVAQYPFPKKNKNLEPNPELIRRITFDDIPSFIFQKEEQIKFCFGPVIIRRSDIPSASYDFFNPEINGLHPILNICPLNEKYILNKVVIEFNSTQLVLNDRLFWFRFPDDIRKVEKLKVLEVEPLTSVVMYVRWMNLKSIDDILKSIKKFDPSLHSLVESNQNYDYKLCPFSRKIMNHPARGVNCNHKECFDLTYYLSDSLHTNKWKCPFCNNLVLAEDLRIDPTVLF